MARELHPSADAGERHALLHGGAWRAGAEDRQRGGPGARDRARRSSTSSPGRSPRRSRRSARRRGRWPRSTSRPRWPSSPRREDYVRPKVDASLAFAIEGGRHPVVEQALKAEGQSFVGNDCDLGPAPPRGAGEPPSAAGDGAGDDARAHLAADRPEHGGQIDLPPAERADRDPGAGGMLRAGASARISASSTPCSRASAPPTIWRAGAPPSWWRWWRRRRS